MAKKKNEKALAVQEDKAPGWLQPREEDAVIEGLENMRPTDMLVPRLVLLQGLSPQVAEGDKQAGQILNSITGDVWIEKGEVEEFIPLYHYLEWIKWADRDTGGGILERSLDPNGVLAQMAMRQVKHTNTAGAEVFTVTEYHNFIALLVSHEKKGPVVISCAKTNIKKGRKLLGLARYRGRYPLFAGKYTIQAILERNARSQQYYVFEFANAGWVEKERYPEYEEFYVTMKEAFKQRRLLSHQQEVDPEAAESETEM